MGCLGGVGDVMERQPLQVGALRRRQGPSSLLLLVHGRSGGEIPVELRELAVDLDSSRGAPVLVQALTAGDQEAALASELTAGAALTLVPLLLLPGTHVRHDLPAIAARWRARLGPARRLWRLPFLGAWPRWQRLLAEVAAEAQRPERPVVWGHHPLEGPLAERYLAHLERVSGARCQSIDAGAVPAAPYTQASMAGDSVALPLALATSRLTELLGPPLLQHPRLRQVLLDQLVALP